MKSTRHFLVEGKVQGVGFRAYVYKKAKEIGVFGLVRNLDDGLLEVLACSETEKLSQLESDIKQGSPLSIVQSLVSKDITSPIEFNEFIIFSPQRLNMIGAVLLEDLLQKGDFFSLRLFVFEHIQKTETHSALRPFQMKKVRYCG